MLLTVLVTCVRTMTVGNTACEAPPRSRSSNGASGFALNLADPSRFDSVLAVAAAVEVGLPDVVADDEAT